jgi:conjugal transfer pilus assembly protein TrbC
MFEALNYPVFSGSLMCWAAFAGALGAAIALFIFSWRNQWVPLQMAAALMMCGVVFWASSPAMAQDELGAAARALIDQAEARGRSAQESLDEWAAETSARTEQYQRDAQELAAGNQRALARGMTMLRNDPTFGDAAAMVEAAPEEGGALYVAVSLGMPKESLRRLALDSHKAGAKIVIRGLVNGSFEQTLVAAKEVFGEDAVSGVAIEPQVFRAFGVDRVPTFIAATAPVQPCDQGVDCTSAATPHDRLAGNITLAEALRIIAERGDEAPGVAQAALARLEG